MKRYITTKHRHASSVRPNLSERYIYLSEGNALLLSLMSAFASRLLGLHGEEPHASEYALLALFAFTPPLLFTLRKFVAEEGSGERSHQFTAEPQQIFSAHNLRQILVPGFVAFQNRLD